MGTNYYAKIKYCKHCNRFTKKHIGKSSRGWTFSFHATNSIRSYKDWLRILEQPDTKIFNEYGEEIPLIEFKDLIMNKKKEKNNHAIKHPSIYTFLDNEGNSMNAGDFS